MKSLMKLSAYDSSIIYEDKSRLEAGAGANVHPWW